MGKAPNPFPAVGLHLRKSCGSDFDLDAILYPGRVFVHPSQVVQDEGLSLQQKRAILDSWSSDACAVDSVPELRTAPLGGNPVTFDEVMDALRALDGVSHVHQTAG